VTGGAGILLWLAVIVLGLLLVGFLLVLRPRIRPSATALGPEEPEEEGGEDPERIL
jgi:hypothetical protein